MIRNALLFLVISVTLCSSHSLAAPAQPFTWSTYATKNNGQQNYPQWASDGNGNYNLVTASGTLNFTQAPAVTSVVFQVYTQGPQGGYNTTPVINYTVNPAATYTGAPVNGWILVGKDNNVPKVAFTQGQALQVVWVVTTTPAGGQPTTVNIPLNITVQYFATN
jgi:hypothetical protein